MMQGLDIFSEVLKFVCQHADLMFDEIMQRQQANDLVSFDYRQVLDLGLDHHGHDAADVVLCLCRKQSIGHCIL